MNQKTKLLATRVPVDEAEQFTIRCAKSMMSQQLILRFLVIAFNQGRITLAELIPQEDTENVRD